MSESTDAILRRAHQLIEGNQLERAQEVLAPLLETESNNPAVWWVYSHAATDSAIGLAALERVLQLDQTYPGARELKADALSAQGLVASELDTEFELASAHSSPLDENGIDDWESIKPAVEGVSTGPRTGRGFVLIIVALLVLASGAVLVLSGAINIDEIVSLFTEPTDEPIIVVAAPTDEATATSLPVQPESTDEPTVVATDIAPTATGEPAGEPTPQPTDETESLSEPTMVATMSPSAVTTFIERVAGQLTDFSIDESQSTARETQLGMTIDILVCAAPGPEFNTRLNGVMDAAVSVHESIPAQIEAFAVSLVNCDDPNASVRTIGVARSILDDFAEGEIDAKTFQRAWRPLA